MMTTMARVAARMRDRILSLEWPPGTPLREVALAEEFGTSRRTVREALMIMEREGIVVHEPNRGARVRAFTPDEVDDLYRARTALETFGAHTCTDARRRDLERVGAAFDAWKAAAQADPDGIAYALADMRFHAAVVALADSARLDRMFGELAIELTYAIRLLHRLEATHAALMEASEAEHAAILDAVTRRDPDRAAAAVRAHAETNRRQLVAAVEAARA